MQGMGPSHALDAIGRPSAANGDGFGRAGDECRDFCVGARPESDAVGRLAANPRSGGARLSGLVYAFLARAIVTDRWRGLAREEDGELALDADGPARTARRELRFALAPRRCGAKETSRLGGPPPNNATTPLDTHTADSPRRAPLASATHACTRAQVDLLYRTWWRHPRAIARPGARPRPPRARPEPWTTEIPTGGARARRSMTRYTVRRGFCRRLPRAQTRAHARGASRPAADARPPPFPHNENETQATSTCRRPASPSSTRPSSSACATSSSSG
jgi:hypothetical protein